MAAAMLITPENIEDVKDMCVSQNRPPELWSCVLETPYYLLVDPGRGGKFIYIISAPTFENFYKFVDPEDSRRLVEVEMI